MILKSLFEFENWWPSNQRGIAVSFRLIVFLILILIIAVFIILWSVGGFDLSDNIIGNFINRLLGFAE